MNMNNVMKVIAGKEYGTWDVVVGNEKLFVGVLERINMGDDDQYVFTDSFGQQVHLDDVGTMADAMEEVTYLFKTSTRH